MKTFRWLTALAYAGLIFYLSSLPQGGPSLFPQADKLMHFILYAGFTASLAWAFETTRFGRRGLVFWMAAAVAAAYGATDELHQLFVPGRSCDIFDWLADALGAAVCALILMKASWRRQDDIGSDGQKA